MKKSLGILTVVIVLLLAHLSFASGSEASLPSNPQDIIVDVDLTMLSSTMRTAELYNMQLQPANYAGKTVKMRGTYDTRYSAAMNTQYHFVVIADAAACCEQGMEFIWNGDHAFPDDYPEVTTYIEVLGVYSVYEEAGNAYYYIAVEDITVL